MVLFLLSGCACGSMPKAGPLAKGFDEHSRKPSIPSNNAVVEKKHRLELPSHSDIASSNIKAILFLTMNRRVSRFGSLMN